MNLWMIYEWFKTLIGAKSLWIMFYKVDGFIRDYNGKYLLLFYPEKDDAIFNRIRCQIRLKSGIAHVDWF